MPKAIKNLRQSLKTKYLFKVLTTGVLIGSIRAILLAVAEESALNAVSIAAGEESVLAQGLIRMEQGLHAALLVLGLAVLHRLLPVASLLLDIEVQTSRATDGLQALFKNK